MKKSRSKKAMLNTAFELLLEVVTAVCSFILPRLILSHFGSTYNGITSSITQFIGCVSLLKSGIGSVTRAALYKPLADNDSKGISEIANATSGFMKRIAVIFSVAILGFAALYPFLVSEDFTWLFSFTLVLILSISTFAQYFFGLTYQMVLQADQRNYLISSVNIGTTILNTIIASIMILMGFGIHAVKLGSAIVFIIPPIFYNIYVRKTYKIDSAIKPNYKLIDQRWDAFGHQIANFINTNTDIIVTTVFLGVREVSVYSIFNMVGSAVKKFVIAIGSGTTAAFGNMIAKEESDILEKRFRQFEILIYYVSTILLTVTAVMFIPFIRIYTSGITDVNYIRPVFGYLVALSVYFACIKIPYEHIVYAAGEFKNTRNGAFIEAAINIVISVVLVNLIGLNGVIIGTIVAIAYRTIRYHLFICDNIIKRNKYGILKLFLFTAMTVGCTYIIIQLVDLSSIDGFALWVLWAVIIVFLVTAIATGLGFILFKKDMKDTINIVLSTFKIAKRR